MCIIDQDYYNTDGNGMILIVERQDNRYAEALTPDGEYVGEIAEHSIMPGAEWLESPNEVIENWYRTFHDNGQLVRPNVRADAAK